ncbi:MAG: mechanosensitive ion channel [Candidatus Omnitrophica bacterium]|nr:mechanosensitive ion channel [Candidatus Omnitrophota bacterium]
MADVNQAAVAVVNATAGAASAAVSRGQQIWDTILGYLALYGMKVVAAILIVIIGKWCARMLAQLLENMMVKSKINPTLSSFTKNIAYFGLLIFVIVAALEKLGIQTTSFIAIIGAAGLAVGLALQGSLANFAAGVMMIIFEPFAVGDIVEAGGASGTVTEIQIFSTIITTVDNKKVIVPNSRVTGDKITVYPRQQKKA